MDTPKMALAPSCLVLRAVQLDHGAVDIHLFQGVKTANLAGDSVLTFSTALSTPLPR
jgi:hypothetical protein